MSLGLALFVVAGSACSSPSADAASLQNPVPQNPGSPGLAVADRSIADRSAADRSATDPAVADSVFGYSEESIGGRFGPFGPIVPADLETSGIWPPPGDARGLVADGSGCTVEGEELPDGLWYGRAYVPASSFKIEFDLMCRYSDRGSIATLLNGDDEATARWQSVAGAALEINDSSRRFTVPSDELAVVERSPSARRRGTPTPLRDDLALNRFYLDGSALTTTPVWILVGGGLVREVHQIDEIDDINRTVRPDQPDLDWVGDPVIVGRIHSLQMHGPAGPVVNVFRPDLYRPDLSRTDLSATDLAPTMGATDCGPLSCGTAILEQYRLAADVALFSLTAEAVGFACGDDWSGEFANEIFEAVEPETMPLGDVGTYLFDEEGRVVSIYLSRAC